MMLRACVLITHILFSVAPSIKSEWQTSMTSLRWCDVKRISHHILCWHCCVLNARAGTEAQVGVVVSQVVIQCCWALIAFQKNRPGVLLLMGSQLGKIAAFNGGANVISTRCEKYCLEGNYRKVIHTLDGMWCLLIRSFLIMNLFWAGCGVCCGVCSV